jgi:hypothetical protein
MMRKVLLLKKMPHLGPLLIEREQHTKPGEVIFTVDLLVLWLNVILLLGLLLRADKDRG